MLTKFFASREEAEQEYRALRGWPGARVVADHWPDGEPRWYIVTPDARGNLLRLCDDGYFRE